MTVCVSGFVSYCVRRNYNAVTAGSVAPISATAGAGSIASNSATAGAGSKYVVVLTFQQHTATFAIDKSVVSWFAS
jgi:hypothetical protein